MNPQHTSRFHGVDKASKATNDTEADKDLVFMNPARRRLLIGIENAPEKERMTPGLVDAKPELDYRKNAELLHSRSKKGAMGLTPDFSFLEPTVEEDQRMFTSKPPRRNGQNSSADYKNSSSSIEFYMNDEDIHRLPSNYRIYHTTAPAPSYTCNRCGAKGRLSPAGLDIFQDH